jgi:hypothetical protein
MSSNFYRTEMDQAPEEPHYLHSLQKGALTDQQVLEKAQQDKIRQENFKNMENLSKDETTKLLKSLLSDVGVGSTWKWDDAFRNIKSDERYQFVKMAM